MCLNKQNLQVTLVCFYLWLPFHVHGYTNQSINQSCLWCIQIPCRKFRCLYNASTVCLFMLIDVTITRKRLRNFELCLAIDGLWAGNWCYRAITIVTRALGLCVLIRRTAPFSNCTTYTRKVYCTWNPFRVFIRVY